MPPRHTKSEFASYLFPAWFLGQYPDKKVIQTAHTAELAVGFGRKVRNLIQSKDFQNVFSGIELSTDSKAGRWNTNKRGDYFAIGVGGAVTGKGADILIIDDPTRSRRHRQGSTTQMSTTKCTNGTRQVTSSASTTRRCHHTCDDQMVKRDSTGQIIKYVRKRGCR